jgi:O-antigen ligase
VIVAIAGTVVPGVRSRFASGFSSRANSDRVFIWSRAAEIIRDHPLHGIGWGNYPRVCGDYYDRVDPAFAMRTWAHNLELSTVAETGPLGLATMLWIWGAALVLLWRRRAFAGLAALAAFLAIAQVHDAIYDTKVMYALWFAVALALSPWRGPQPARAA